MRLVQIRLISLFILSILLIGRIHGNDKADNFPEIFRMLERHIKLPHRLFHAQTIQHPNCMKTWIDKDIQFNKEMKEYFHHLLGVKIEEEFLTGCKHLIVLTGNDLIMPLYSHHFPHFADVIFRFFSLLLWQNRIYPHSCLQKLMINNTRGLHATWEAINYDFTWIHRIAIKLNQIARSNLFISDEYPPEKVSHSLPIVLTQPAKDWNFVHPSDAFYLTNLLLHRSPCYLHGAKNEILKKPLKIIVVNRRDRKLLNSNNLLAVLHETLIQENLLQQETVLDIVEFEDTTFDEQVHLMSETDIVIGVHGAAMTNLVFMKPCSVAIEIYPWLFHGWYFFDRFAKGSDVLHYTWMEPLEHTIHNHKTPTQLSDGSIADCQNTIQEFEKEYNQIYFNHTTIPNHSFRHKLRQRSRKNLYQSSWSSPTSSSSNSSSDSRYYYNGSTTSFTIDDYYNMSSLTTKCMLHPTCNICVRFPLGIIVTLQKMVQTFKQALNDRQICIENHPYYTSSYSTTATQSLASSLPSSPSLIKSSKRKVDKEEWIG